MLEPRERREHAPDIACGAPAPESPIGNFSGVGCKAQVQDVDEIDFPTRVAQSNYVAQSPAVLPERLDGVFDATRCKVAQERIARAERQESKCRPAGGLGFRKKAIDDLVGSAVAAYGEKISITLRVGFAREARGLTRAARLSDFKIDAGLTNAPKRSRCEFAAAPASGRRIDDGKEVRVHGCRTSFKTGRMEVTAARPPRGQPGGESVQPARPA